MSVNYQSKDINDEDSMIRDDKAEKDASYAASKDLDLNHEAPLPDQDDEHDRNKDEGIDISNAEDTA